MPEITSSEVMVMLKQAGVHRIKVEGDQLAFPCPFHDAVNNSARYHLIKHAFYCFGGCTFGFTRNGQPARGLRGKAFWKKLGIGDIGFIDYVDTLTPDNMAWLSYEEFVASQYETLEKGARLFEDADPISRNPRAQEYLIKRLGPNYKMPIECRYHIGKDSLVFWNGRNYVQKPLEGRYITYGDAYIFTHLEQTEEIELVEGQFDYLCVHQTGFPSGASMGLAITDLKINHLREMGVKRVYLGYDNDIAGIDASLKVEKIDNQTLITMGPAILTLEAAGFDTWVTPMVSDIKDFGDTKPFELITQQIKQSLSIEQIRQWQLEELCASNPY